MRFLTTIPFLLTLLVSARPHSSFDIQTRQQQLARHTIHASRRPGQIFDNEQCYQVCRCISECREDFDCIPSADDERCAQNNGVSSLRNGVSATYCADLSLVRNELNGYISMALIDINDKLNGVNAGNAGVYASRISNNLIRMITPTLDTLKTHFEQSDCILTSAQSNTLLNILINSFLNDQRQILNLLIAKRSYFQSEPLKSAVQREFVSLDNLLVAIFNKLPSQLQASFAQLAADLQARAKQTIAIYSG